MSQRIFVTGTDTGVGKTVASTVLTLGLNANYWKPIQTGSCSGTDRDFVNRWLGDRTLPECYVFPEPASPNIAASIAGQKIELLEINEKFLSFRGNLVIEGAGGIMVPINDSHQIVDLMTLFSLPTIVITSTRLGTINHTLLTLDALRLRSVSVVGFVTVGEKAPGVVNTIEHFSGTRSLGHIPFCQSFSRKWFQDAFREIDLPLISEEPKYVERS